MNTIQNGNEVFMKNSSKILIGALAAVVMAGATLARAGASLNGAGATFPYPIYSKWFYEYNKSAGVAINYQSIGSGGGIQQLTAGTVDFGASDAPMTDDQISKVKPGVLHFPTVAGAVAVAYNLTGVDKLKLDADTLEGIFYGTIKNWNDKAIADLNPGVTLPTRISRWLTVLMVAALPISSPIT